MSLTTPLPPEPDKIEDTDALMTPKVMKFREELEQLLNKHSKENESNTPDFLLAGYLVRSLMNFDTAVYRRDQWYLGTQLKPAQFGEWRWIPDKRPPNLGPLAQGVGIRQNEADVPSSSESDASQPPS